MAVTLKKTVLITGAATGLGAATARHFARQGWRVAATMRSLDKGRGLLNQSGIELYPLDVTSSKSVRQALHTFFEKTNRLDVVINNAGIGAFGAFEALDPDTIRREFEVNLFGVMNVMRETLPYFRNNGGGLFINISSVQGKIGHPLTSAYAASKFALEGFSESVAFELEPFNIRVKLIEPGGINTEANHAAFSNLVCSEPYEAYKAAFFRHAQAHSLPLSRPEFVAERIYEAAIDGTDRFRYPVGDDIRESMEARNGGSEEEYMRFLRRLYSF